MIIVMKTGKHKTVVSKNSTNKTTSAIWQIAKILQGVDDRMYGFENGYHTTSMLIANPRHTDKTLWKKKFLGFNQ